MSDLGILETSDTLLVALEKMRWVNTVEPDGSRTSRGEFLIPVRWPDDGETFNGFPRFGDPHPRNTSMICQRITIEQEPDAANQATTAGQQRMHLCRGAVEYSTARFRPIRFAPYPVVDLDIQPIGVRREVDALYRDKRIGSPYFWRNSTTVHTDANGVAIENPDAELGAELVEAQISATVTMPAAIQPPNIMTIVALTGTVNIATFDFGTAAPAYLGGFHAAPATALYLGARMQTLEGYRIGVTHGFQFGLAELPQSGTIPIIQDWDGAAWPSTTLPIGYGYFARYRRDEGQPGGNGVPRIMDLRVFHRYPQTNFNLLGSL